MKGERGSVSFREPIILENAKPPTDPKTQKLRLELFDVDTTTADDLLGVAEVDVPTKYAENIGENDYDLFKPDGSKKIGTVTLDQMHFIKQKLRRYTGPCKCCCFCMEKGVVGGK